MMLDTGYWMLDAGYLMLDTRWFGNVNNQSWEDDMSRLIFLSFVLTILLMAAIISVPILADEPGLVYDAPFPVTVSVDGDLSDWPLVTWHKITHDMGWDNLAESDDDASLEFACVAGEGNLYVALKIRDDLKCVNEDSGNGIFQDDSVEIYIDGDNSKPAVYEPDVCQISIGRYNVGRDPSNPMLNDFRGWDGQGASAVETGTKAAVVDTDYGWAVEAAIPLAFFGIGLADGKVIGFNVHLNDDDDQGERDHWLGWSKTELAGDTDTAYMDPSVFGQLKFVSVNTYLTRVVTGEERGAEPVVVHQKSAAPAGKSVMTDETPEVVESNPAEDAKEISSGSKFTKVGIIVAMVVGSIILGLAN